MRKNIKQLRPEDLPEGVEVNLGNDYRGRCYLFDNNLFGYLGKLIVSELATGESLLTAEFYEGMQKLGEPSYKKRKEIFGEAVQIVDQAFKNNFGDTRNLVGKKLEPSEPIPAGDNTIFLYSFELINNGINFVLNEGIARDMNPKYLEVFSGLVELTCIILDKYKLLTDNQTIFKAKVMQDSSLDLAFSTGLGKYIDEVTKNRIYDNAKMMANICASVMDEFCKRQESCSNDLF